MDKYKVTFIGHKKIFNKRKIEEKLLPILTELILSKEYVEFYVTLNGDFDEIVASVVKKAQQQTNKNNSSLILVLPFMIKNMEFYEKYYDEIIIPYLKDNSPTKSAMNIYSRWLVGLSDMLISYVKINMGEAYDTEKYATSQNKKIINLKNITVQKHS